MTLRPVRVLVVDDDDEVRALVRAYLARDERFEVVAEAADGAAAVERVSSVPVDLVVLDRDMPVMDGIAALPRIHERSPGSEVVVYTAQADAETRHAATAAGAAAVVDKRTVGGDLAEQLAGALLARWGDDADVRVRVGPVAPAAAAAWTETASTVVEAVLAHPGAVEAVDAPLAAADVERAAELLARWRRSAEGREASCWVFTAPATDLERVAGVWEVLLGALGRDPLAALGCSPWPADAQSFVEALTGGLRAALERHRETRELAALVRASAG